MTFMFWSCKSYSSMKIFLQHMLVTAKSQSRCQIVLHLCTVVKKVNLTMYWNVIHSKQTCELFLVQTLTAISGRIGKFWRYWHVEQTNVPERKCNLAFWRQMQTIITFLNSLVSISSCLQFFWRSEHRLTAGWGTISIIDVGICLVEDNILATDDDS